MGQSVTESRVGLECNSVCVCLCVIYNHDYELLVVFDVVAIVAAGVL